MRSMSSKDRERIKESALLAVSNDLGDRVSVHCADITVTLIDDLESAEYQVKCAQTRIEYLAAQVKVLCQERSNNSCPHACPVEAAPSLEECDACWDSWSAAEAAKLVGANSLSLVLF